MIDVKHYNKIIVNNEPVYNTDYLKVIERNKDIECLVIPEGIEQIGTYAFSNFSYDYENAISLKKVVLPKSLKKIGSYAFCYSSVQEINLPDGLLEIDDYAFEYASFNFITIPASVQSVGYSIFGYSSSCKVVFCEAANEPSGWQSSWYGSTPVVWDCNNNSVATDGYSYKIKDNILYQITESGAIATCPGSKTMESIAIPDYITIDGVDYPVVEIAENFMGASSSYSSNAKNTFLHTVTIGNNVERIGNYAFENCQALTNLDLGTGVKYLGSSCFSSCPNIISLVLPSSLIELSSFYGAYKLYEIYNLTAIPNDEIRPYFDDDASNPRIIIHNSLDVPSGIVYENGFVFAVGENDATLVSIQEDVSTIVLPNYIRGLAYRIGKYCFYNLSNLENLYMPDTLLDFDEDIIVNCPNLKFNQYKNINYLGSKQNPYLIAWKADDCEITECEFATETQFLGYRLLTSVNNVQTLILHKNIKKIQSYALTQIKPTIVNYIGTLDDWCNMNFTSNPLGYGHKYTLMLNGEAVGTDITLTTLKPYAFYGVQGLETIRLADSVKELPSGAFSYSSVVNIYSNAIEQIGSGALSYCAALALIELPATLKTISTSVCESEPTITRKIDFKGSLAEWCAIPHGSDSRASYLLAGTNTSLYINNTLVTTLSIPSGVTSIARGAFSYYNKLTSCNLSASNLTEISISCFENCSKLKSVTFPTNLQVINDFAFSGCSQLQLSSLPSTLTTIGWYAFSKCTNIYNLTIPDSVIDCSSSAFKDCSVSIGVNHNGVIYIPSTSNPYYYLFRAKNIYMAGNPVADSSLTIHPDTHILADSAFDRSGATQLIVPEGITTIPTSFAQWCEHLTLVVLPSTITSIGYNAFYNSRNKPANNSMHIYIKAETPPTLGSSAFSSSKIKNFYVPTSDAVTKYKNATNWSSYGSKIIQGVYTA